MPEHKLVAVQTKGQLKSAPPSAIEFIDLKELADGWFVKSVVPAGVLANSEQDTGSAFAFIVLEKP